MSAVLPSRKKADSTFGHLRNATLSQASSGFSVCVRLLKWQDNINLRHISRCLLLSKTKAESFSVLLLAERSALLLRLSAAVRQRLRAPKNLVLHGLGAYKAGRGLCMLEGDACQYFLKIERFTSRMCDY